MEDKKPSEYEVISRLGQKVSTEDFIKKITNPNEAAESSSPNKNLKNGEIDFFGSNKLKIDMQQSDIIQKEVPCFLSIFFFLFNLFSRN